MSCSNLIALGFDATLLDLEVVTDMAACAVSFCRVARGELTSAELRPEILSSSLFTQKEILS